jgi:hypothetical protein
MSNYRDKYYFLSRLYFCLCPQVICDMPVIFQLFFHHGQNQCIKYPETREEETVSYNSNGKYRDWISQDINKDMFSWSAWLLYLRACQLQNSSLTQSKYINDISTIPPIGARLLSLLVAMFHFYRDCQICFFLRTKRRDANLSFFLQIFRF